MALISKACKPKNFELNNSLKLGFTNIWSLRLYFVDCESFLESNSPGILALLCKINLDDSTDSGNFSGRSYLPPQLMWRKDFLFHRTYHWKTLQILTCFLLILLHSVPYFFLLCWSPSSSFCTVFDSTLLFSCWLR